MFMKILEDANKIIGPLIRIEAVRFIRAWVRKFIISTRLQQESCEVKAERKRLGAGEIIVQDVLLARYSNFPVRETAEEISKSQKEFVPFGLANVAVLEKYFIGIFHKISAWKLKVRELHDNFAE